MPIIVLQILAACAATVTITTGLIKLYGHIQKVRHEARQRAASEVASTIQTQEVVVTAEIAANESSRFENLPTPLNPLIGREAEKQTVRELLGEGARLITLAGPGGIGKSRLAIELGWEFRNHFKDGVAFVSLVNIQDVDRVFYTITKTLGLREMDGVNALDSLETYLENKDLLLILDNFEGVVDAAPLLAELLMAAPDVTALVTSREVLNIHGEHLVTVSPLAVPDYSINDSLADLSQNEAVHLFVQRAHAAQPRFSLTETNAPTIAEICRRLEGLPLAIELAAARINLLSPKLMLERLDNPLSLLTGGSGTVDRHQTLRDTISWSYNLLTARDKMLFRRLAVFVDGFTLEAAEAVCCEGDKAPEGNLDVLKGMASLVDKSLLRQREDEDGPRFSMMESIRELALEKLEESGEAESMYMCHAHHYLGVVREAEDRLRSREQMRWLAIIDDEMANLRAAYNWCLGAGHVEHALLFAGSLRWYWSLRGSIVEGRRLAVRALEASTSVEPTEGRGLALLAIGALASIQGDNSAAREPLRECIRIARKLGNIRMQGEALGFLGNVLEDSLDPETSPQLYDESYELRCQAGDAWGILHIEMSRGTHALHRMDYEGAQKQFETALVQAERLGELFAYTSALNHLGDLARCRGDYVTARHYYQQVQGHLNHPNPVTPAASLFHNLGYVELHDGNLEEARRQFLASLELHRAQGDIRGVAEVFAGLAGVAAKSGDWRRATRLFGASDALLKKYNLALWPSNVPDYRRSMAATKRMTDEESFIEVWQEGQGLSLELALAQAKEPLGAPPLVQSSRVMAGSLVPV